MYTLAVSLQYIGIVAVIVGLIYVFPKRLSKRKQLLMLILFSDAIPFEARIMAIADVYDALVSKRCYKDKMSFEQAFQIIEDGMGSQFDKKLEPYFVASREELEQYYSSINE